MPRAYFVSECAEKYANPLEGQPTYLLVEPIDWNDKFEHWYVDENYACIDDMGNRYSLSWHPEKGIKAAIVETSQVYEVLFRRWLQLWIDSLPERVTSALSLPCEGGAMLCMETALNDPEKLKRIANRR